MYDLSSIEGAWKHIRINNFYPCMITCKISIVYYGSTRINLVTH